MTPHKPCNCKESPAACPIADLELAVAFSDAVQGRLEAEVERHGDRLNAEIGRREEADARVAVLEKALREIKELAGRWRENNYDPYANHYFKLTADKLEPLVRAAFAPQEEPTGEPRWHDGMREHEPAICWRYLNELDGEPTNEYVCILERGHGDGIHEPTGEPECQECGGSGVTYRWRAFTKRPQPCSSCTKGEGSDG